MMKPWHRMLALCGLLTLTGCSARHARSVHRQPVVLSPQATVNARAAFARLMAAAQKGDPEAQLLVGICLQRGWGTPLDEDEAEVWFRRAAKAGQKGAAMELAALAWERDERKEARRWLEQALADGRGMPEAHMMLASMYIDDNKPRAAVQQLRAAAIGGCGEAAYLLSACYEDGYGVPREPCLVRGWRSVASELGYVPQTQ